MWGAISLSIDLLGFLSGDELNHTNVWYRITDQPYESYGMLSFFTIIYKMHTRIDKAVESGGSFHTLAEYMNELRMFFRSINRWAIIIHALQIHLSMLDFGKADAAAEYYNKYHIIYSKCFLYYIKYQQCI